MERRIGESKMREREREHRIEMPEVFVWAGDRECESGWDWV